ncbi:MBL fold metallo-hydrolase [Pseudohongiella sp. SYSU M77423]|uniref:MBL fold metallo-hydrolase n=1 Tax=Pseudohongiella sp. SYSU M77423 TaxID=3042312 RepID=UPI000C95D072|nr:MBL fold metallo-hydrolase [Pseudohongiella sp. SYSU M77423]MAY56667.1 MBL fold metallo-hydrolase [Gammaproteobacteria bacterium]MDH7944492.1 MBL fold metallo-hydrolase [Pseudohongiella sp. SYSU M77423]HBN13627.1 MBL fold metallo-hydrolase [Pseudohongiella sp.]
MDNSRFVVGSPTLLRDGLQPGEVPVHRILCPNASTMTGPGTNTYLIGSESMALVDPGPALPEHIAAIEAALEGRPLERIFVTHTHGDHSPGAMALHRATGAELIGLAAPPGAAYQDTGFQPSRIYHDQERIECDGFTMRLISTPGHVSNHLCFLLEEQSLLFTGDHILQGTTPVILPPDGDMKDYLDSLEQLRSLPLQYLAPGHGELMSDPEQMISALIRHRQRRELKIITHLADMQPVTLKQLVVPVYDDVPAHLLPWAEKTLLAHLLKLEREGRARQQSGQQTGAASDDSALWSLIGGQ